VKFGTGQSAVHPWVVCWRKKNTKQPIGVELVTIEAVVRTSYQQLVSRSAQSSSLSLSLYSIRLSLTAVIVIAIIVIAAVREERMIKIRCAQQKSCAVVVVPASDR